jgi:hypothetical protein
MPEVTVARALLRLLRARFDHVRRQPELGGIISEYAVVLTIAVAAIGIVGLVIAAIRARFQAFGGSGGGDGDGP